MDLFANEGDEDLPGCVSLLTTALAEAEPRPCVESTAVLFSETQKKHT